MSFISESKSAIRSRFGFQEPASDVVPSVQSSPDLLKSALRENFHSSAVRNISERDDDATFAGSSIQSFELHEDPSFWKDHNVQVIIRIRPLSSSEISLQGYNKCIRQDSCQAITWTGHPESRFTFDLVADENVSQEKLFKVAGLPMVDNCMGGYNSCMFAYGQTGSGKTHTMLGDIEGGTRRHSVNCGMTPRVFEYLFSRIQKEKEARRDEKLRFTCKCSFLEIYNEQILDLLEPSSANLQHPKVWVLKESPKDLTMEGSWLSKKEKKFCLISFLIFIVKIREDIKKGGAANRKVAATNMNRASSRSHSVFTCIIESKVPFQWESQGVAHHRFARLNLVDLAGSERQKSSGAEGERLKEATNINKSLSTLGLVIMNLVNMSNGKSLHVPYRDSKLTFLLQDSLGGNAKTIIIANVSPSNCCSLETLSTLKFAQRAKFIKNNAIVNEDASGDVLAMRMQIQQLKKEVARMRGLANGGAENQDNDTWTVTFPGSPGSFNWEGLHGSLSPLTSNKRVSQKKEYEVALVGAFRREKDKDIALQALAAENQAAMQLAKQRQDEIQGLKMRLRFSRIRTKEVGSSCFWKISAEAHLLKEKEEHLKEIEVLRMQLLEALDWKLMHESDHSKVQKQSSDLVTRLNGDDDLLVSNQDPEAAWHSSINQENEFLRLQAIQNQAEMDALRKKLALCLEEKEKIERHVNELVTELEEERSSKAMEVQEQKLQSELPSLTTNVPSIDLNGQIELKTMVDAIAAASQREAEAHETAFILSKENDELRLKLKVLIEDNNKLIELYERAVAETNHKDSEEAENAQEDNAGVHKNDGFPELTAEKAMDMKRVVENLEHQLMDMHEENEKLMVDGTESIKSISGEEMLLVEENGFPGFNVQEDGEEFLEFVKPTISAEAKILIEDTGVSRVNLLDDFSQCPGNSQVKEEDLIDPQANECFESDEHSISTEPHLLLEENGLCRSKMLDGVDAIEVDVLAEFSEDNMSVGKNGFSGLDVKDGSDQSGDQIVSGNTSDMETKPLEVNVAIGSEDLNLVRMKLDRADEKLSSSAKTVTAFGLLEKAVVEVDKISREIGAIEDDLQLKQQEFESLKILSSKIHDRRALVDKKLSALKYSLSSFSTSAAYFEQREAQARARVNASSSYLGQKKDELARLQACKDEIEAVQRKLQHSDKEIPSPQINWHLGGKATALLKSEEEKTKLQAEMKQSREKLGAVRREIEDLNRKSQKVETAMQTVEMEMQKSLKSVEEMQLGLQGIVRENEMLLEIRESGKTEIDNLILENQQSMFEADLKLAEMSILEEELSMQSRRIEELCATRAVVMEKYSQLLKDTRCLSSLSEKLKRSYALFECRFWKPSHC
ncbi:Kinesin-like protein KIN-12E [Vitis vinifera]|uniref:Kinesin-like protein KIN-12E n=1 Tax=Vitis vinifera TaxID=29760 RepID=A0A438D639_VITVI|nr:Kinesin-like protein KIN-12E [Vitis vinifera]